MSYFQHTTWDSLQSNALQSEATIEQYPNCNCLPLSLLAAGAGGRPGLALSWVVKLWLRRWLALRAPRALASPPAAGARAVGPGSLREQRAALRHRERHPGQGTGAHRAHAEKESTNSTIRAHNGALLPQEQTKASPWRKRVCQTGWGLKRSTPGKKTK